VSKQIQAIRGMNDILPEATSHWQFIEKKFIECVTAYAYQEIRFPIVESTHLFKRSIGEVTDIVEKEMYTFSDLNGDSLTLRPEGTAGCVRACLQQGLLHNKTQKLWYCGPMFRHEKPQKGRYRQFQQFGIETFGFDGVAIELELIQICHELWDSLGLSGYIQLEINSIGTIEERNQHKTALIEYFTQYVDQLDDDSKRRLSKNPLRILDSKNKALKPLINKAPKLSDYLSVESKHHFESLCHGLEALNINYTINPYLVRGLDYYSHTVFEWTTQALGAQGTVCAGGRYDSLVEQLGGKPVPAMGLAMGMERILLMLQELDKLPGLSQDAIYIINLGETAQIQALKLAATLRKAYPSLQVEANCLDASFKSQFKKADKSGAVLALILGEDEVKSGTIGVKWLRKESEQLTLKQSELLAFLQDNLV